MKYNELLLRDLPGSINKEGTVLKALLSDKSGNGAIEKEFKNWNDFANQYIKNPSVYNQSDDILDKTINFFSYFERFNNESDTSLKKRFTSIFNRNGDTSWGNSYDVKNVFKYYFSTSNVFLMENVNDKEDTLIQNGDFIDEESEWNIVKPAQLSTKARFSKKYGILFPTESSISQEVVLDNGYNYFLHWFQKGTVSVEIVRDNLYWNFTDKVWQSTEYKNTFTTNDWLNKSLYFSLKSLEDETSDISVVFIGDNNAYLDYVELFQKKNYCSFTVLVQFEGDTSAGSLALAEGTIDNPDENIPPNVEKKAENWGYFDNTFITGPQSGYATDIYNDLLNYVRSCGVAAYLDFVTKDYISET